MNVLAAIVILVLVGVIITLSIIIRMLRKIINRYHSMLMNNLLKYNLLLIDSYQTRISQPRNDE
jgi:hypothetical protein